MKSNPIWRFYTALPVTWAKRASLRRRTLLCSPATAGRPRIRTKCAQKTAAPLCRSAAAEMSNAMAFKSDHRGGLFRGNAGLFKHVHAVIFGSGFDVGDLLFTVVEAVPDLAPIAACRRLAIFGRAGFEEVGVLDAVQQGREPWQRVVFDHVNGLEAKLPQAPIGNVADVAFDFLGGHAGDGAHFEREVDEIIFQTDDLLTAIDNVFLHRFGEAATLGAEGVEELGDAFAMQRFVAHRPGYDLPHALHLVEAWEVHQHREGGE